MSETVDRLRALLQPLLDEKARARELAEQVPGGELYFGLIGAEPEMDLEGTIPGAMDQA